MASPPLRGSLDLLLLGVLRSGPAHGYTVIEQLRSRSNGAFDLAEGTVYPALHKLERDGLLSSEWAAVGGRQRRIYKLTRAGRKTLAEQEATWRQFVRGVTAVLGET